MERYRKHKICGWSILWYVSQGAPLRRIEQSFTSGYSGPTHFALNSGKKTSYASGGWISNIKTSSIIEVGIQEQFCFKNIEGEINLNRYTEDENLSPMNLTIINSDLINSSPATCELFGSLPGRVVAEISNISSWQKPWITTDGVNNGSYEIVVPPMNPNNSSNLEVNRDQITVIPYTAVKLILPTTSLFEINQKAADPKIRGLIFGPGNYSFSDSIEITQDNFVVLGLGYPIISKNYNCGGEPLNSNPTMVITGNNCWVNSMIFDAASDNATSLLHLKSGQGSKLHDIYTRIFLNQSCDKMIQIDQDNVYCENLWCWKADHGFNVDYTTDAQWDSMVCPQGLEVNGNGVTICGLAVEHQSDVMTLWNGNDGACYFYQSEYPYAGAVQSNVPCYKVVGSNHTFSSGGGYFVNWVSTEHDAPTYDFAGEFPEDANLNNFIGANFREFDSITHVVKKGVEICETVNSYQKSFYCSGSSICT